MASQPIRIATRGSKLALIQAQAVKDRLAAALGWGSEADAMCRIVPIKTTGDRIHDRTLVEEGGKGLFAKEIEEALLAGDVDLAVHSAKDMPSVLPRGLGLAATIERGDPRDVFIARDGTPFASLKPGARLGTSSVRRRAQALRARRDLSLVVLRGNVDTRLARLAAGEVDAVLLAKAGTDRLGLVPEGAEILAPETWLPALCQGAIGIELKEDDARMREIVRAIDHRETSIAIACERAFLGALDGSCRTPVAGLARVRGERLEFHGEALTLDGREAWQARGDVALGKDPIQAAITLGTFAGRDVRARAGDKLPRD